MSRALAADGEHLETADIEDTKRFNDVEMDRVLAELGIAKDDANYILIDGSYTIRNGERQGGSVLLIKKPSYLNRLCVVEPNLFYVRISETELKVYRDNVWRQRFVGLVDSSDECSSITWRTMQTRLLAAPTSVELDVVREILESEDRLIAAVANFEGMNLEDGHSELRLAQIIDADGYADNAECCAIVFRDGVKRPFQVCLSLNHSQLEIQSVNQHFHKYGIYED